MVMKNFLILFALMAFLATGCSDDDLSGSSSTAEPAVGVSFRMDVGIDTDTSVEPMTRATSYKNWFKNSFRLLILKKTDSRWIVEGTQSFPLDAKTSAWNEVKLSGDLPAASFDLVLRPGDYRIVAVLNWQSATWNSALVPGSVVADENNPLLHTPPLLTYVIIKDHPANNGYRMLSREIFVATADFTVPKSSDLHGSGMQPLPLHAQRCVGKIRMLVKDKPSAVKGFTFDSTPHTFRVVLKALDKPFAEGIDALGGMYYSDPGLYELPWCMSTMNFHISGNARYQLCQTNSTVFSPFLFIDPAAGEQPVEVSVNSISGASEGFVYKTDQVFTRTLAASKIIGIVFQTTDISDLPEYPYMVHVVEATDDQGNPENAVTLFDPYFEWNAEYDY